MRFFENSLLSSIIYEFDIFIERLLLRAIVLSFFFSFFLFDLLRDLLISLGLYFPPHTMALASGIGSHSASFSFSPHSFTFNSNPPLFPNTIPIISIPIISTLLMFQNLLKDLIQETGIFPSNHVCLKRRYCVIS